MKVFSKENEKVFRTVRDMNPFVDLYTLTLEELIIVIKKNAEEFQSRLKMVTGTEENARTVAAFFDEYSNEDAMSTDNEYYYNTSRERNKKQSPSVDDATHEEGRNTVQNILDESESEKYYVLMKWLELPYHAVMNDRLELLELCLKTIYDMRVFRLEEKEFARSCSKTNNQCPDY